MGDRPLDHRRSPVYWLIVFFRRHGLTVWALLTFLDARVFILVPWSVGLCVIGLTAWLEWWCVRHARDITFTDEALLTVIRRRRNYDAQGFRRLGWRTVLLFFVGICGLVLLAGGVLPMLWPGPGDLPVTCYVLCSAACTLSAAAVSRYWGDVVLPPDTGFSRHPPYVSVMRSSGFVPKERIIHVVLAVFFVPLAMRYRVMALVAQFGGLVAGVTSIFFAAQSMTSFKEDSILVYVFLMLTFMVFNNSLAIFITVENFWMLRLQSLAAQVIWDEANDPKGPGYPKQYWFSETTGSVPLGRGPGIRP